MMIDEFVHVSAGDDSVKVYNTIGLQIFLVALLKLN